MYPIFPCSSDSSCLTFSPYSLAPALSCSDLTEGLCTHITLVSPLPPPLGKSHTHQFVPDELVHKEDCRLLSLNKHSRKDTEVKALKVRTENTQTHTPKEPADQCLCNKKVERMQGREEEKSCIM